MHAPAVAAPLFCAARGAPRAARGPFAGDCRPAPRVGRSTLTQVHAKRRGGAAAVPGCMAAHRRMAGRRRDAAHGGRQGWHVGRMQAQRCATARGIVTRQQQTACVRHAALAAHAGATSAAGGATGRGWQASIRAVRQPAVHKGMQAHACLGRWCAMVCCWRAACERARVVCAVGVVVEGLWWRWLVQCVQGCGWWLLALDCSGCGALAREVAQCLHGCCMPAGAPTKTQQGWWGRRRGGR